MVWSDGSWKLSRPCLISLTEKGNFLSRFNSKEDRDGLTCQSPLQMEKKETPPSPLVPWTRWKLLASGNPGLDSSQRHFLPLLEQWHSSLHSKLDWKASSIGWNYISIEDVIFCLSFGLFGCGQALSKVSLGRTWRRCHSGGRSSLWKYSLFYLSFRRSPLHQVSLCNRASPAQISHQPSPFSTQTALLQENTTEIESVQAAQLQPYIGEVCKVHGSAVNALAQKILVVNPTIEDHGSSTLVPLSSWLLLPQSVVSLNPFHTNSLS